MAPVCLEMKSKHGEPRGENEKAERNKKPVTGLPESPASRETFPEREKRPGQVGLANEARPGLGTRAEDERERNDPHPEKKSHISDKGKPKATPHGYEEPRPEPREQEPNSLAHEQERSTGVSGHMGNT